METTIIMSATTIIISATTTMVIITKIILTLIIGFEVVRLENVVSMIDVFVTATGNKNIIMAEHMA